MNNKRLIIIIIVVMLLIIALWLGGVIPKQIGKIYGTKYLKNNFPEMQFEYVNIEWNKFYGDYIISFKDKDNQIYSCVISPKYFPISIGQGINAIEEKYKESYSSNTTTPYIPDGLNVADGNEVGIPADSLEFNRKAENVTIEIMKDTITNESAEILIKDNNQDHYGWGKNFRIQKKVNDKWEELTPIKELSFIEIAYEVGEDNQIKLKVDYGEYYGTLDRGIYRIVKPVYDNGYIDLYSNEFEIK